MTKWKLYWVASDGLEDCFVVAKNSRSAKKIEKETMVLEQKYRHEIPNDDIIILIEKGGKCLWQDNIKTMMKSIKKLL